MPPEILPPHPRPEMIRNHSRGDLPILPPKSQRHMRKRIVRQSMPHKCQRPRHRDRPSDQQRRPPMSRHPRPRIREQHPQCHTDGTRHHRPQAPGRIRRHQQDSHHQRSQRAAQHIPRRLPSPPPFDHHPRRYHRT